MDLKKKKAEVKSFLSKNKFNFINLEIDNKGHVSLLIFDQPVFSYIKNFLKKLILKLVIT